MNAAPDSPPPYDGVAFDCDSTLSAIEGIDELAADADGEVRRLLEDLTNKAMGGELRLEEVYERRLDLVRPTRERLVALGDHYVRTVAPNARELVGALRALGKRVSIVSGGLRTAVLVLAEHLGVDAADVHAVELEHGADGSYLGLAPDQPLARSGGKIDVLRAIGGRTALVGDGVTDLEAAVVTARFVAYAGIAARPRTLEGAAVRCDTADFRGLAPLLLSAEELERLPEDLAPAS